MFRKVFPIICLSSLCVSTLIANADEYYSDDIFTAIAEAKERTHHYDYSSALRYNRSTSQSIQIPRLMMLEMGQTSIETPELADIEGQGVQTGPEVAITSTNSNADQSTRPSMGSMGNLVSNPGSQGVTVRAYAN